MKQQKAGYLKKIKKIDKLLENLTNMRREKIQISKTRNETEEITRNTKDIQGIIRHYFENIYSNKLENLEEMGRFLDTYDQPKLNLKDINHLNKSITCNEIEAAKKSPPKEKFRT
jgi:hypothetical protein